MQYRAHRYTTDYPVHVNAPMGNMRAAVSNVNEAGAQLRDAVGLNVGDPVQFQVLHERISAIVQWAAGGRAGLSFHPRITIDQIDAIRNRAGIRRHTPTGQNGLTQTL